MAFLLNRENMPSNLFPLQWAIPLSSLRLLGLPLLEASVYRRLIHKLVYLTQSRPDISFSVSKLSHNNPTFIHLQEALRTL